jgi:hypothetical protein
MSGGLQSFCKGEKEAGLISMFFPRYIPESRPNE